MPLARAKRLSDKTEEQERKSSALPVTLGILVIGSIGIGGFYFGAPAANSSVLPPQANATQIEMTEPVETELATVATIEALPELATLGATEELATRPRLAPCVDHIEYRLRLLHTANANAMAWPVKKERIQDVAQSVLDCDLAQVALDGNIELAASDIADLRVRWDRNTAALDLMVVDSVPPGTYDIGFTPDGQPSDFIVH